ncbi:MAG: thioredoxin domain-containing protein, partial [Terriglobales bacterium]
ALHRAALAPFALNKEVLRLTDSELAPQNLPPALAETLPNLPGVKEGKTAAVVCSGFVCRPPITDPVELARILAETLALSPR